eukprot:TRINITY_DN11436_c0_g1_i1.p1 TRINITY_DN11436_c0_g1~~TRINITY_DN11436_c0_g1_i1.p1  ORF type:complete len:310 (-),score=86.91 TRINITY_DN11436_c0_g1_i1:27-929(-)
MEVLILLSILLNSVLGSPMEVNKATPVPVVLWHGMGDSAAGMTGIESILKENIDGVYVHRIMIGGNIVIDTESGFFRDTNRQISEVCEMMANDPELQDGYNAIGFSQGGQFLRAVAQRCPNPPMKNLVTFGAQHQGVFGFPNCPGEMVFFCDIVRDLLNYGAYVEFVQDILVQAQYWHDPLHFDTYVEKSKFLAEINNEKTEKNASYAINLAKLENFVLVKHTEDSMVEPRESEHFEFYVPGQADVILPLRESPIYVEDRIGLKALDEAGKLHFMEVEGDHLQFSRQWLIDNIIEVFFKN